MKRLIVVAVALIALGGWQGLAQAHKTRTQVACPATVSVSTNLTVNCTGSITIAANGITLNCKGHTVSGPGSGGGIIVPGRSGVTIEYCNVKNFANNFYLKGASKSTLMNNTSVHNTSVAGFFLGSSRLNVFVDNLATGGATSGVSRGFFLTGSSSENSFRDNAAVGNAFRGFDIQSASNGNVFNDNIAINNGSAGFVLFNANQNRFTLNRAMSNASEGFIVLPTSNGNVFKGNQASGNGAFNCQNSGTNSWGGNTGGNSSPPPICFP